MGSLKEQEAKKKKKKSWVRNYSLRRKNSLNIQKNVLQFR